MPKGKATKSQEKEPVLCVENLRHAEYYDMQDTFDELYAKSKENKPLDKLMEIIMSRQNILLAYRNIKANTGSRTPGTDRLTMDDIGKLPPDEVVEKVRYILVGGPQGYRPKPVRRKEILKPNGKTRPLGIPCIWDRLIQQCIKQVLEPICEAKFSDNSYGFRPNRSIENAVARMYNLMQKVNLHYIVEFDIKGFFDNVNHSKLIRQLWAMGIQDKTLLWVIRRMLKAPIRMPDGTTQYPEKGTPQGGIISPLLANVVLNELDHWIEYQWQYTPVMSNKYATVNTARRVLKEKSNMKEMYIVRYADDFRIFCRTKSQAERVKTAVTKWLQERLKLEVSEEKTRVVNAKRKYSEFLGFKIKVVRKGSKRVVKSRMCDKARKRIAEELRQQAINIAKPRAGRDEYAEIKLFNSMVMGIQNHYCYATHITIDCKEIGRKTSNVLINRLHGKGRLAKTGRKLTPMEEKRYGKSEQIRWVKGTGEPIFPIGYVKKRNPMCRRRGITPYTAEGRAIVHENLKINVAVMHQLMRQPLWGRSAEYMDNRISLFSAQWGKCAITGEEFTTASDIHCHHKKPKAEGGSDKYENLVLVCEPVHKLIHASKSETIQKYLLGLKLNKKQLQKLNEYRELAGKSKIA